MFRAALAEDDGLLMVQRRASRVDSAIHMLWMRIDLTVVWMDNESRVVDVRLARRWTPAIVPVQPARYVLECHTSRLNDFQIGDQLEFIPG